MEQVMYEELRKLARALLARERIGHTLQATALVHEAFLRLSPRDAGAWNSRGHFFGAAARAMRQILVDHARGRAAAKRGGGRQRVDEPGTLPDEERELGLPAEEILTLNRALEQLEADYPRHAEVVELRYFAGLTIEEIAELRNVASRTIERDWRFARAWLERTLTSGPELAPS
jgi:RNA polymerase sigma factor (TIGR02999 family)